jgi:hypothetical protein
MSDWVSVDFSNLGAAMMEIDGTGRDSLDVSVSFVKASVPVPGTIAILGLGLAGLGFARKMKKA